MILAPAEELIAAGYGDTPRRLIPRDWRERRGPDPVKGVPIVWGRLHSASRAGVLIASYPTATARPEHFPGGCHMAMGTARKPGPGRPPGHHNEPRDWRAQRAACGG